MFKAFTWAKFFATIGTVGSIAAGLGGEIGVKVAAVSTALFGIAHAVTSLVTTWKSGTATDASGKPVNESGSGK